MLTEIEKVLPSEIEKRSFEIIAEELGDKQLIPGTESIVKRCIHTSADFDYADNLIFSENVVEKALKAIRGGASIVTDTQMGKAGINKKCLAGYGGEVYCFMSDDDVAQAAKRNKTTRAAASMDKAAKLGEQVIFAIGNAPTALVRLYELIKEEKIAPELVIAVPVGFVNVVQSKELILSLENTPYIVARGRKGGSNIAACICNALLYMGAGEDQENIRTAFQDEKQSSYHREAQLPASLYPPLYYKFFLHLKSEKDKLHIRFPIQGLTLLRSYS